MKRIIIVGPAAAGKDFLKQRLGKRGYKLDVSYTSREPREGEVDGVDYNFISEEEFKSKIYEAGIGTANSFYEWAQHGDYFYGTGQYEWDNCEVFIMETEGIEQISPEERKDCLVIYLNPFKEVRFERLWANGRDWSYQKIAERFEIDDQKFKDFKDFDIQISNPDF